MLKLGKFYIPNLMLNLDITKQEFDELFASTFIPVDLNQVLDNDYFLINNFIYNLDFFKEKKIYLIENDTLSKVDSIDKNSRDNCYIVYFLLNSKYYAIHFKNSECMIDEIGMYESKIIIDLSGITDIEKLFKKKVINEYINKVMKHNYFDYAHYEDNKQNLKLADSKLKIKFNINFII